MQRSLYTVRNIVIELDFEYYLLVIYPGVLRLRGEHVQRVEAGGQLPVEGYTHMPERIHQRLALVIHDDARTELQRAVGAVEFPEHVLLAVLLRHE